MSRTIKGIIGLVVLVAIVVGGYFGVQFFLLDNAEVSQSADEGIEELDEGGEAATVFTIDPSQSTAEFRIDEVLRGQDVTVLGTTSELAGQIQVNAANPSASEVSEIRVNARALETDAGGRNRALRNFILNSSQDQYEFIVFQPTAIQNMPESVSVGEEFSFQVVGDLTVVDATNEVTWDVTVTPNSETEIEGVAETTIQYPDYNITIPEVPFVASVEDDVTLTLNFVATEGEGSETVEEDADETTDS